MENVARGLLRRLIAGGNGRGEIAGGEELIRIAFGSKPSPAYVRAWGQPLRELFPPGRRGRPVVEAASLREARCRGGELP